MQPIVTNLIIPITALFSGGLIGYAFGLIQKAATRRHESLQNQGKFTSGWAATPGSFRRVAFLLVALALVQFLFPVFFEPGGISQWCVSIGVVGAYGWTLFRQLRPRRT